MRHVTIHYKIVHCEMLETYKTQEHRRIQYNTDATTVTSGTEILSGFISSGQAISVNGQSIQLGRTVVDAARSITGTSDVITLAIASFGQNSKVASLLGWSELI